MFKKIVYLVLLFSLDRLFKNFFWQNSSDYTDGFFTVVKNTNIAFSVPLPQSILIPLLFFLVLIVGFESLKLYKQKDETFFLWGLIFIGASSNILDRFKWEGVIDYINLQVWPIFNLADSFIFLGVVLLIWREIKKQRA